jgi:hypothetical protein
MKTKESKAMEGVDAMDMTKYAGSQFIKFEDVRDGPWQAQIAEIREGKYDKPEAVFATGEVLGLNATNCRTLMRAYGSDSEDWVGKTIELYLGKVEFQGQPTDSVMVRPISQPIPAAQKAAAAVKGAIERKTTKSDMDDDDIPL